MNKLIALAAVQLAACASAPPKDPMAQIVAALIEQTTRLETEYAAFAQLEALGEAGIPYIVGRMNDPRPLPKQHIELRNNFPGAFEGIRHYRPATVHGALAAIINQVTGKLPTATYFGESKELIESETKEWAQWCVVRYPAQAHMCEHGI